MRRPARFAALFAIVLSIAASLDAATFVVPQDRELVRRAHLIVIGSALTSYTRLNSAGGVETVTPISVEEIIAGPKKLADTIDVVEPGGRFGDQVTLIPGSPQFEAGERVLLMLRRTGADRWSVAELILGKFTYASDVAGQKLLVRDEEEIAGWDSNLKQYQERRRAADRFLNFVRSEARGVAAPEDYFVKTEPLVAKHVSAQSVSALATFTATSYSMTVSGSQGSRWKVFPSGVNWFSSASGEPGAPGNGATAVTTGINSWDNDSGSNVNYVYGGTDSTHTTGLAGADGANTVLFERDLSSYGITPFSCSGSSYSGTLGIGGISSASGSNTVGGETFVTTTEGDVEMNRGIANCTALFNNGDWNSALTHELGHTLGFRHADQNRASSGACSSDPSLECSSSAIMRSSIPNGLNANLQQWDVNAVRAIYPGSSPPPCTAPSITGQPQSQTLPQGGSVTLTVTATGTAPLTYQWYIGTSGSTNSAAIQGATGSSVTVSSPNTYWVRVTNSCGFKDSVTATVSASSPPPPPPPTGRYVHGDYNGDHRTDPAVFRPSNSFWFIYQVTSMSWGSSGDQPVPNDYDGDKKTDEAIWRPSNGTWLIRNSSNGTTRTVVLGQNGDIPASADYDGDGKADLAVFRPSNGTWLILNSSTGSTTTLSWGQNGDQPVPADYNGDGRADVAVYRPSSGVWFVNGPVNGASSGTVGWGVPGDIPVPADYDGDGDDDICVYRPSSGFWFVLNGGTEPFSWGVAGDIPVPGDYDGNGRYDRAVYRPSNGNWYVLNGGIGTVQFGSPGDVPQNK
jgi:hypothetical protein